ncbi:hypothetical protein CJ030_MR0G006826 [Morella rubra]|uniref:Uncharacterized protein n=1 Tax=Morella rubra TaxID=262757 RepID=A0A6A1UJD0_9ROSI|nr:hypothetical protein CJ030_MR0G006826 [Morella rubra]
MILIFMSEEFLDLDLYILVMTFWTYVTKSFEVFVGYELQWYLKEPSTIPDPLIEDFKLTDFDPSLFYDVPPPPAQPVEGTRETEVIDLTSDTSRGLIRYPSLSFVFGVMIVHSVVVCIIGRKVVVSFYFRIYFLLPLYPREGFC